MIISSQGFGHFTQGLNNQDFGLETGRMILVLDGCSGAKYSEVGTKLFAQLFSKKKEYDNYEKFEENVKEVFDELLSMMEKYYPSREELEDEFVMDNLLFTIIACFDTEDKFIVKLFGDGYIITQNVQGLISYMKFTYGKYPPYFAYKYCSNMNFEDYHFKTFEFDKKFFTKVAISTDGISPIAKGEVKIKDNLIFSAKESVLKSIIQSQKQKFLDDVTIGILEGGKVDELTKISL